MNREGRGNSSQLDRPIFIVGLPRTGSTLWLNVLAQNPDIYRISEMLYLSPWRKDFRFFIKSQVGSLDSDDAVQKLVDLLFDDRRSPGLAGSFLFKELVLMKDPRLVRAIRDRILLSDRSLESIFKAIVEETTLFHGYRRFCVKFPVYISYVPELLKWYPEAKIVHIIRDPRAIAVSKTNDPLGTQMRIQKYPWMGAVYRKAMVLFSVVQYIWASRLHQKYKDRSNYTLFRYEDLLTDPRGVIKGLCAFIGIAFVPEMLDPKKGQASSITGKQQEGFSRQSAVRWKSVISPFWNWLITTMTRGSMRRFDYDPATHPVFQTDSPSGDAPLGKR